MVCSARYTIIYWLNWAAALAPGVPAAFDSAPVVFSVLSAVVPMHRFQADIAFDGEELARRALDRCGRVRLFKVGYPSHTWLCSEQQHRKGWSAQLVLVVLPQKKVDLQQEQHGS